MGLPYFPMFPTDFEAKTSHLTLAEDGAYNRLLRLMWMTAGCSIPDDDAWIKRRMRCSEQEFQDVVLVVIEEFCIRKNGRVSNAKLTQIFEETSASHKKRVSAGSKGGKAKSLKNNENRSSNATAKPKQPEPEPEPYIREEPKGSLSSGDDVRLAFDAYNEAAREVGWPVAQVLSRKRRTGLAARLKDAGGLDGWGVALAKARASPLCTGDNRRGWVADLDFFLQQKSFTRLMEGSYDKRNSNGSGQIRGGQQHGVDPSIDKITQWARTRAARGAGGHDA